MKPDPKNPFHVVLLVAVCAVAFYYLASPYQNCVRSGIMTGVCIKNTGW
jgi:hypothetical protein